MKKVLIAVTVLVALGVVAQRGTVSEPTKVVDPTKVKRKEASDRNLTVTDDVKSNNAASTSTTKGNAEVKDMPEKSGREIGMERAEEVRSSHAEPKTEEEAKGMIESINADTQSRLEEVNSKLDGAEVRMLNAKNNGEMSDAEFELKKAQLDALRARSEALEMQVK